MIYGSNAAKYQNIVTDGYLPKERAVRCQNEYQKTVESWMTLLEPWRRDSTPGQERLQSTLQSIRRRAVVRVTPTGGGYLIDLAVYKELEDLASPQHASVGQARVRHETTLNRNEEEVGVDAFTLGWIPLGRDASLEQRILHEIRDRTTGV